MSLDLAAYRTGMFIPAEDLTPMLSAKSHSEKMNFFHEMLNQIEQWYLGSISLFKVGVCGVDQEGNCYMGVNAEFPNTAINTTIHAEQFLVTNVFNHGGTGLLHIYLKASPCGHCRQFLSETVGTELMITVFHDGIFETRELKNLLPFSFGPSDLGVSTRLLQPERDYDKCIDDSRDVLKVAVEEWTKEAPILRTRAVQAARKAFAPYTGVHEGCALQLENGVVCTGSSMESAAFNPSLTAVQGALIEVYRMGFEFISIRSATIVTLRPENTAGPDYVQYSKMLLMATSGIGEDCIDAATF